MSRCKGKTKAGKRCKIEIDISPEGYCKYHHWQATDEDSKNKHMKYMKSDVWKVKRAIVLGVLGETCKLCGRYGNHIHHNTYDRLYHEDLLKDLTVLCSGCHRKYHKVRKK